ncbi:MAG TPA: hypothetical protein VKU00_19620 [Chthonomonadaceae bacterium]|nr:hypothetical protein [Chthonomonadaceae bacterium]
MLLIGVMAALIISAGLQSNHLLAHATRITDAPDQASPQRFATARGAHYLWLSDDTALGMTYEGYHDEAFLLNAHTRAKTPLDTLNTALQTITPTDEQHLSPDGKWLLWTGVCNSQHMPPGYGKRYVLPQIGPHFDSYRAVATAIDGSRQIDTQQGNNLAWFPDSQSWIRLGYHLNGAAWQTFTEEQSLSSPQKRVTALPNGISLPINGRLLGVLPDKRLLILCGSLSSFQRNSSLSLCTLRLDSKLPSVQSYPISLPFGWTIANVKLSPSGYRLAWQAYGRRNRVPRFLMRFPVFASQSRENIYRLWVTDVDGSHRKEVGEEAAPPIDGWDLSFYDLSWLPDGKHLSFIFRGALWTVSTP